MVFMAKRRRVDTYRPRRRRSFRRGYGVRRRYRRRTGISLARVRPELKAFDQNVSITANSSNTTLQHLTPIVQGDDSDNRDGRRVHCKYIYNRISVSRKAGSSTGSELVRIIFFKWHTEDTPVVTDILKADSPHSHNQLTHNVKYRILRDMLLPLDYDDQRYFYKVKLNVNKVITYASNLGSAYSHNSIWMLVVSNAAASTEDAEVINRWRVRYYDC